MEWITLAWKYRNEVAIGVIILVLGLTLLYIKHVFNDRETLRQDVVKLQAELVAVQKQVTLNEDIAHAISKIKVQSNNYVRVVETSPSPSSNSISTLIPAGLLLPSGMFKTYSATSRTSLDEGSKVSP